MKTLTKKNKIETSLCEECSVYGVEGFCYKKSYKYIKILCSTMNKLLPYPVPLNYTLKHGDTINYVESNPLAEDGENYSAASQKEHEENLANRYSYNMITRGYAKKGGCSRRDDIVSQWLDSYPLQRAFKNFSFALCNKESFPDIVFNEFMKELKRYKTERQKIEAEIQRSIDKVRKAKDKVISLMMNAYLQHKDFALLEEVMDYYYLTIYGNMGDTSFQELYEGLEYDCSYSDKLERSDGLKYIFSSPEEIKRRWEKIILKLRITSIGKSKKWGWGGKKHLPHPDVFTPWLMRTGKIHTRIKKMKDSQEKTILERYYQGGATQKEIAEEMKLSQATVSRVITKFKKEV